MRKAGGSNRVALLDELRGLSILLMVAYHTAYDLTYLFDTRVEALFWPVMKLLQPFFAGVFILISGIACRFSRSNAKRGLLAWGLGLAVSAASLIVIPETPIYFGILHLLGSGMLLYALLQKPMDVLRPLPAAALLLVLFALTYAVPQGKMGLPPFFAVPLPKVLAASGWLAPLGFVGEGFVSVDYYPLLPWLLLFFAGAYLGLPLREGHAPPWVYTTHVGWLAAMGRHTLLIYLLHQPIVYGLLWLYFKAAAQMG